MGTCRTREEEMEEKRGEHPFGDTGQLILLGLFLFAWAVDSFYLDRFTYLAERLPLYARLIVLALSLAVGIVLVIARQGLHVLM